MTASCSRNRAAASRIPPANISSPISSATFSRAISSPASSITTTSRATSGRIVKTGKIVRTISRARITSRAMTIVPRSNPADPDGDVNSLPSFITGGQPQQNAGPNGHDSPGRPLPRPPPASSSRRAGRRRRATKGRTKARSRSKLRSRANNPVALRARFARARWLRAAPPVDGASAGSNAGTSSRFSRRAGIAR